jgi:hypothetical protein
MNFERLDKLKGSYNRERIFIIGHGTSIRKTPLDELDDEYTFGVNKVYKLFDDFAWRPTFYFNCHPPMILQELDDGKAISRIKDTLVSVGSICFFDEQLQPIFGDDENIYYFRRSTINNNNIPIKRSTIDEVEQFSLAHMREYWSDDITNLVYEYHSMYSMLQISAYLGFDEIYLLGCDLGMEYINPHIVFDQGLDPHRFSGGNVEFIKEAKENNVLVHSIINGIAYKMIDDNLFESVTNKLFSYSNSDYFSEDYYDLCVSDGKAREKELIKGHIVAKNILQSDGVEIYNATQGGELEVYERKNITDLIDEC